MKISVCSVEKNQKELPLTHNFCKVARIQKQAIIASNMLNYVIFMARTKCFDCNYCVSSDIDMILVMPR
jgi:hypothetical protein